VLKAQRYAYRFTVKLIKTHSMTDTSVSLEILVLILFYKNVKVSSSYKRPRRPSGGVEV